MLNIFTLALNSEPYIRHHLPQFEKLGIDWKWTVAHGTAANVGSTGWCRKIDPGLSTDGTTEYLQSIKNHPNVTILERPLWDGGKDEMCNACLDTFKEGGVLMQIDSDEIWFGYQLDKIVKTFKTRPDIGHMRFCCHYFVGKDIITVGDNCYGNYIKRGEWARAWRWDLSGRFSSHEPPRIPFRGSYMSAYETKFKGLIFDHYAWALRKTAEEKERFYGYVGAAEAWDRLQANIKWPVRLKDYFYWSDSSALASKIDCLSISARKAHPPSAIQL